MKKLVISYFALLVLAGSQTLAAIGDGKVVGLDEYFNDQIKPDGTPFHYIWEDTKNSGYSEFGKVWQSYGATLASIKHSPTPDDLNKLSIYIICNPDNAVKAAHHQPNFIESDAIDAIVPWVQNGGVLAIFANDEKVGGCEFVHLNHLSQKFGITINDNCRNYVPDARNRLPGTFAANLFPDHPLFHDVKMIFMKEICTLEVTDPAKTLLLAPSQTGPGQDIIMATSHFGKGLVYVVGDPWFYNEYIDVGKKTPNLPIENRKAAENLAQWLLSQSSAPSAP